MTVLQREGEGSEVHDSSEKVPLLDPPTVPTQTRKCAEGRPEANRLATPLEAHVEAPLPAIVVAIPTPRTALVAALGDAVKAAALAGDLEAVRIAADALTRLVGLGTGDGAEVVDLAGERARR